MTTLLHSKFETYLLDEEHDEQFEGSKEYSNSEQEREIYPRGFFSEL